jgi:hypothetical protein
VARTIFDGLLLQVEKTSASSRNKAVLDFLLIIGIPFRLLYNRGRVSSQVLFIRILDTFRHSIYMDITTPVSPA